MWLSVLAMALVGGRVSPVVCADEPATAPAPAPRVAGDHVECTGRIEPRQKLPVRVRPGETVAKVMVGENAVVRKDDLLVQFANPSLDAAILSLQEKINQIGQDEDQLQVCRIELAARKGARERCEKRMAEEKALAAEISAYRPEAAIAKAMEERAGIDDAISALEVRIASLERCVTRGREVRKLYDEQMTRVQEERNRLLVRAPFAAKVMRVAQLPERLDPGECVLEVWEDGLPCIRASVPQHMLGLIVPGATARVYPAHAEGPVLNGVVESVGYPDEESRPGYPRFPVCINVSSAEGLREGMAVLVHITVKPRPQEPGRQ